MKGTDRKPAILPRPKKVAALGLLALIALGLNLHLFFLQLYGWSGMFIDFQETTESWTAAAQKTVSGEAPCNVCRQVDAALVATEFSDATAPAVVELSFQPWLFLLALGSGPVLSYPPAPSEMIDGATLTPHPLTSPPAAPPPRAAAC